MHKVFVKRHGSNDVYSRIKYENSVKDFWIQRRIKEWQIKRFQFSAILLKEMETVVILEHLLQIILINNAK